MAEANPAWSAKPAFPRTKAKAEPYYYNENPNKWQLGIAFALVRFRSSVYYASAPGLNTSLAYWCEGMDGDRRLGHNRFRAARF